MTSTRMLGLLMFVLGWCVIGAAMAQEPGADPQNKTQAVQRAKAELPPVGAPAGKNEIRVLVLRHAKAAGVAKALQELLPKSDGFTIRFASEPNLNVLLIRSGSSEDLEVVQAVVDRLEKIAQELEREGK
jgi:hypothetical protein